MTSPSNPRQRLAWARYDLESCRERMDVIALEKRIDGLTQGAIHRLYRATEHLMWAVEALVPDEEADTHE